MRNKPEGVLTGGGAASHMLLRDAGGDVCGTKGCCAGLLLAGLGASGLADAGGEACSSYASGSFATMLNLTHATCE